MRVTASSLADPEPMRIANSSASDKAEAPSFSIFSLGRSSAAHWLMLSFPIDVDLKCVVCVLLIEFLFECRSLIRRLVAERLFVLSSDASFPPGFQEAEPIAHQLGEGGGDGE